MSMSENIAQSFIVGGIFFLPCQYFVVELLSMRKQTVQPIDARQQRQRKALEKVIARFGSLNDMANLMQVKYQLIQGWQKNYIVPIKWCAKVETVARGHVKCEQLNEDWAPTTTRPFQFIKG